MEDRSLQRLEYDKILERLAAKAQTGLGKERARALRPESVRYRVEHALNETNEAFARIVKQGDLPIGGMRDVREYVGQAEKQRVLGMGELLNVADTMRAVAQAKAYGEDDCDHEKTPILDELFGSLALYTKIEKEITRCILSPEQMDDHASTKLFNIRMEIVSSGAKIRNELNTMIHSQGLSASLQDSIVTVRDGRFCLPVKASERNNIRGMIHDQSSSGSTVFIEPQSVVHLNNHIAELEIAEQEEVRRILQTLSAAVGGVAAELSADIEALGTLDLIFAKARLAMSMDAMMPTISDDVIALRRARHPLIDAKKVVPIEIGLGGDFTTLVITGPNTGGKTVSLKTLGLLTLMAESGLFIPASSGSTVVLVDRVFADIGDEQSIEQSLSTFSAHMLNISEIVQNVTKNSLVLFDELGAGTDPVEGAALATAILDALKNEGVLTAATTHYSELKTYALSTPGVENASCEFDLETLRPTYRLLMGVPGKSNAFEISKRLGLSDAIIANARERLASNDVRFEDMMSELEMRRIEAQNEQERLIALRTEIAELNEKTKRSEQKLGEREQKVMDEAREAARQLLKEAKAKADELIGEMNTAIREGASVDVRRMEEARAKLRQGVKELDKAAEGEGSKKNARTAIASDLLKPGNTVHLMTLDADCIVLEAPNKNGDLRVRAGILQMKVNAADLCAPQAKEETKTKKPKTSGDRVLQQKSADIATTCDLRGLESVEAVFAMDKYLDDAYLAGLQRVTILHGKGTGALREAVQKELRKSPHVASFRLGSYGEGDSGVTIVELKNS